MPWFVAMGERSTTAEAVAAVLRRGGVDEGPPSALHDPGIVLLTRAHDTASVEFGEALDAAAVARSRVIVAFADGPPDIAAAAIEPWELLDGGADDVVTLSEPRSVEDAIARLERWAAVEALLDSPAVRNVVLGDAPAWRAALREVVEVARFTSSPMLITGETGTGKEVVARLVHALDPRPSLGELVLVDCTTVVPSLSGSEFFGHERGAFTGASAARAGAFARADRGTLFLDEVGELPVTLQAELLRVVQEGMYKPVGGDQWHRTSFRLVAATNRDLLAAQADGEFRSDFYFRLAGAMVHLPPLRDRIDDAVPLFRHFFAQARGDDHEPELDPAVERLLREREYPGNLRDLRQLALRVATRHVGRGPVTPGDIPPSDRTRPGQRLIEAAGGGALGGRADQPTTPGGGDAGGLDDAIAALEDAIRKALARGMGLKELKAAVPSLATRIALAEAGGPSAAARLLGVSRRAVDYRKATGRSDRG